MSNSLIYFAVFFVIFLVYTPGNEQLAPKKKVLGSAYFLGANCWLREGYTFSLCNVGLGFSHELIHIDKPKCRCGFFLCLFSW